MSNLSERKLVTQEHPDAHLRRDERVEDFLDNLCAPLVGIVPYRDRNGLRQEAREHIDGLIREYTYEGMEAKGATEAALREFGEPWRVGQLFLQEWSQGTPQARPTGLIRKATLTAFAWFGLASMLNILLLDYFTLSAYQDSLLALLVLLAFLSPFAAGALAGLTTSAQIATGVRNAMLLLILHSFVTGLILLPKTEGVVFALWQWVFWLPAGRVTASLTAACMRHFRRQRFWQIAR